MHTATQLESPMFAIEIDGKPASREDVLPDWGRHDRFGVISTEPFGALGASLLIQLAITAFYDFRPARRGECAQYPEIYVFHIGQPHGDHSYFDFWPERKEVTVADDAGEILSAINDRGITRLAVVDGRSIPAGHRDVELEAAKDRIRSAFVYHASGRVTRPDVVIAGLDARTEINATMTLDPERALATPVSLPDRIARSEEGTVWRERFSRRASEIPLDERLSASARRESIRNDGCASESYRRASVEDALNMLTTQQRGRRGLPVTRQCGSASC